MLLPDRDDRLSPEAAQALQRGDDLLYVKQDGSTKPCRFDNVAFGRSPSKTYGLTTWIYVIWPYEPGGGGPGVYSYPCQDFMLAPPPPQQQETTL